MSGIEVVQAESAADASDLKVLAVTCPAGKVAIGGGGFPIFGGAGVSAVVDRIALRVSVPFSLNRPNDSWAVHAFETQPDPNTTWRLRAVAVCATAG